MSYRPITFAPGEIYHICHRGINQQSIFHDDNDRHRFLNLLVYCNQRDQNLSYSIAAKAKRRDKNWPIMPRRGQGLTDLLSYCLMDNHIHLLLHENIKQGVSTQLQRTCNAFAKYFNARRQRTGGLFTGRFRAVHIDGDEQFLQISRYIHLNPYAARMVNDPVTYHWSSLTEYTDRHPGICHTVLLASIMKPKEYLAFVNNYSEYARDLADIKHLTLES